MWVYHPLLLHHAYIGINTATTVRNNFPPTSDSPVRGGNIASMHSAIKICSRPILPHSSTTAAEAAEAADRCPEQSLSCVSCFCPAESTRLITTLCCFINKLSPGGVADGPRMAPPCQCTESARSGSLHEECAGRIRVLLGRTTDWQS